MELLIVIAIIGILATTLAFFLNPAKQLARARDTQREADLYSLLSTIYQYQAEHSGTLPDTDDDPLVNNFPTSPTCIGTNIGCFDLGSAGETGETIIPSYVTSLPMDPKTGDDGNTGYVIYVDANRHLTASASGETRNVSVSK